MEQRISIERMEQAVNIFGSFDENIRLLEKLMRVRVALRGGDIVVEGEEERNVDNTREILKKLCALAEKGERVDTAVVQYAVSLLEKGELDQLDNLYGVLHSMLPTCL